MFPYEFTPIDGSEGEELFECFKGHMDGFVRVGPKKWVLPQKYTEHAEKYYNFQPKEDDLWVMTFPRSGTTVMQELLWLINNGLDYNSVENVPLLERFPFFEFNMVICDKFFDQIAELNDNDPEVLEQIKAKNTPGYEIAKKMKSPRHFKTHLPPSLLHPSLIDTCKVVYVARNPFDVAVSFYHHNKLLRAHDFQKDFKKYWELFERDLIFYGPYWEHVKEGWEQRNHPNVLFLFYEDLLRDFPGTIKKIANFLNKKMTDDEVENLTNYLHIDNFRKKQDLRRGIKTIGATNENAQGFIRRGKVGGNEEFVKNKDTRERADKWFKENLESTTIKFPEFTV